MKDVDINFEQPIVDLLHNLKQAEELGQDGIEVKQTISDLKNKLKLLKMKYSNLSAWQKVQLSRHTKTIYS